MEPSNGSPDPTRPTPYLDLFGNFLENQINLYVVFLTLSPQDINMLQIDFQICPRKLKKFIKWHQVAQQNSPEEDNIKVGLKSNLLFESLSCHY